MALQEMSLKDAMSRLETLYQQGGEDGTILMRVQPHPRAAVPQRGPTPDYSGVSPPSMFRESPALPHPSHHQQLPERRASPQRGRSQSPPNENQWRLNYQVPKDAYGRYAPDKDRPRSNSPTRVRSPQGRRSRSPQHHDDGFSSRVLSSQPTKSNKVPRYQYNPHDLTLSGPMSPPNPEHPVAAPSVESTAYMTPSHYTPPAFGDDPRHRSLLSPGASLGARSARAHGAGPEMWSLQSKTHRYDASPSPAVGPVRSQVAHVSPTRQRSESPTRNRVHVVAGSRGQAALVHSLHPSAAVVPPMDPRHGDLSVISPPRPTQQRGSTPQGGRKPTGTTPHRTTTPKRVATTPKRTTTPKRSNRYNHIQAKITRVPQPAPKREHYEPRYRPAQYVDQPEDRHSSPPRHPTSPRREKVTPFFASSSQPHHQHANASLSPQRSGQAKRGISWVVPSM